MEKMSASRWVFVLVIFSHFHTNAFATEPEPVPEELRTPRVVLPESGIVPLNSVFWVFNLPEHGLYEAKVCTGEDQSDHRCVGDSVSFVDVFLTTGTQPGNSLVMSPLNLVADQQVTVHLDVAGSYDFDDTLTYTGTASEDTEPPSTPQSLQASSDPLFHSNYRSAGVKFRWEASFDDSALAFYRIESLDEGEIKTVGILPVDPDDIGPSFWLALRGGVTIRARVRAVDIAGNESEPSEEVEITAQPIPPSDNPYAANPDEFGPDCACVVTGGLNSVFTVFPLLAGLVGLTLRRRRRRCHLVLR